MPLLKFMRNAVAMKLQENLLTSSQAYRGKKKNTLSKSILKWKSFSNSIWENFHSAFLCQFSNGIWVLTPLYIAFIYLLSRIFSVILSFICIALSMAIENYTLYLPQPESWNKMPDKLQSNSPGDIIKINDDIFCHLWEKLLQFRALKNNSTAPILRICYCFNTAIEFVVFFSYKIVLKEYCQIIVL